MLSAEKPNVILPIGRIPDNFGGPIGIALLLSPDDFMGRPTRNAKPHLVALLIAVPVAIDALLQLDQIVFTIGDHQFRALVLLRLNPMEYSHIVLYRDHVRVELRQLGVLLRAQLHLHQWNVHCLVEQLAHAPRHLLLRHPRTRHIRRHNVRYIRRQPYPYSVQREVQQVVKLVSFNQARLLVAQHSAHTAEGVRIIVNHHRGGGFFVRFIRVYRGQQ